ncbi:glycosyltransferase [Lacticaseibacillus paracasei]|uniref:glycosyltransferase n=1 Tax=Lacticaseibacillus paracasei TaxID=1597 RepID=UPI0021A4C4D5|nr:glycosyltransferase [Lacticaseibacillus paracasei]UWP76142.1 glycosyltransferase [Lacticaseibacillus paracasei]
MKSVLMVSAAANMIWQFNRRNIEILQELGVKVVVATNFEKPGTIDQQEVQKMKAWFDAKNIAYEQIDFERGMGSLKSNFRVIKQLREVIRNKHIDIIHSQSPIGGVLSRIAGFLEHTLNIYTAHGFHFFKGAPLKYWLVFFPIEYSLSFVTDLLITINDEDYARARHMHAKIVAQIPGVGVDVDAAMAVSKSQRAEIRQSVRGELGLSPDDFMILNIGELSHRKNQIMLLRAMSQLGQQNVHVFLAGIGPDELLLRQMASDLDIKQQVHFLGYRNDIRNLHYAADVNVFPSRQEGLALGGLESVVDGLYILGSNVRGIRDYIIDDDIGQTFKLGQEARLAELISEIEQSRPRISDEKILSLKKYDRKNVDYQMQKLYSKILGVDMDVS